MLKTIHVITVFLSLILFTGRGFWIYILDRKLVSRWLKIGPHINDTLLLVTGISLAIQLHQYPVVHDWLTVKIVCLMVYILLGMVAMKWRIASKVGMVSWLGAILVFLYMVLVALYKNPLPVF